jgi:iron complex transport system permease protein
MTAAPSVIAVGLTASDTRRKLLIIALAVCLAIVFIAAIGIGPALIAPSKVLSILLDAVGLPTLADFDERDRAIVMAIRLPRACLGVLVGVGLALSGALLQGLFRNPLADPGLIGISAGAALAAVATIVLAAGALKPFVALLGAYALPVAAFLGCLTTTALIYRLGTFEGRSFVATMLLAGIAINALAMSGTGFLVFMSDDRQLRDITFWMLGSLGGATWAYTISVAPFILATCALAPMLARALNAFMLGEREAGHLGFNVETTKIVTIVAVAMSVGASVAVSGVIGFVGLMVPHLVRLIAGSDHRLVLPGSALVGATLLLLADIVARMSVAPAELPIGIVTSVLGGPFFLWLLLNRRRELA